MIISDAMPARPMSYGSGIVLVLAAGVLWSLMGLGVRLIHEASAFQILFYRSLGVLPCLLALLSWRNGGHPVLALSRAGWPSILGGLGLAGAFMGAVIAFTETSIASASFLFATTPVYTAILGRLLLGEAVRPATAAAIGGATIGVGLMVVEGATAGHLAGNCAALASAFGFAVFTIALRWEPGGNSLPGVFFGGLYCCAASAAVALWTGQGLLISPHDAGIAFGLGFGVLSGGLTLYTLGSRVIPAAELPLLTLLEVVLGPVWVFLVLGEGAGPITLMGGAMVLLSMAGSAVAGLVQERRGRARVASARQVFPA